MTSSFRNAFLTCLALLVPMGCIFSSGGKGKKLPAQVHRGYYAFTVPQPYANLNMDSAYALAWTTSDSAGSGPVRIALYRKEAFLANLSASTANNGTYTWSLPSTRSASGYRMGSGGEYRLRITNAADSSKWDFSEWFSMYSRWSGYVSLTAPASGARAKLDSVLNITWTSSGDVGPFLGLQLYKDTLLAASISTLVSNNGTYSWLRASSSLGSGDDYHIRLFSVGDPSISSVGPAFRIVSGYAGGYAFRFPAAGDTLTTGGFTKATWTVTGNPGASAEITLWRDSVKLATVAYPSTAAADSANWTVPAGLTTSARYRLRIASASDAGIAAWSPYFTIKGAEADAYENDDSLSLSKAIVADGKVQAHTLTLKDMDWMRFAAKAEKRYLVSLRSSVTMYVNVLDTAGRLLKEQSGANVQITLVPGYSGVHHVKVFPYSASASALGPYQIAVSEYDSTGSPFNAGFTAPDGKTTWAAGSRYNITWAPDSLIFGASVVLSLYDDTALVAALTSAIPNLGTYAWDIPAGTYTGQKYRLRMSPYGNPQVFAYGPHFAISGVTPDAYEPDNVRLTAKTIAADGKPQQRGLSIGDQDWIRFNAAKGRRYVAAFSTKLSMTGYMTDSSGIQLSYQTGYKIALALAPAYNGPYYIRVIEQLGNGDYSVALTAYDSTADGYQARFTVPDSAATWAAGTAYTVSWAPDSALFGANVNLALWQDDQFIQTIASSVPNTGSFAWTLHASLATGPRYRLRMTGTATSSTPAATGFGPRFSISGIVPDAYEPDQSKAAAKPMIADGLAQQRNLTVGDTDWVRIDGLSAKTYIVSVNGVSASVLLSATDSAGASLASQSGTKFAATFTPTKDGRVYLRMTSYSGFGPYALTAVAYTAGQDGVPVKFTAPDSGTAWSAGSSYTASWNPDSAIFGSAVGLALIKSGTLLTTLVSSQANTGTASVSLPAGLATGSDYRIRLLSGSNAQLYGHSAPFSIGGIPADSFEPNDSSAAAKAWVPNAPRQTLSLSYRDKDWYRFAATAQMLYLFQAVSPASLHTTMRVWPVSGTGALLTGTKTGADTLNSLAWVAPAAGNYAVSLEAVSAVTYGSYAFEIKEVDPGSYKFPVAAPAAGAAYKAGDAISVQWSDPAGVKGQVDLFLYNADGVVQTVAANQANTGAYAWTAPAGLPARSDYYVKIISRLNSGINGASGAFSLAP